MPKKCEPKPPADSPGNFYHRQDGGLSDELIKAQLEEQFRRAAELEDAAVGDIANGER